MGKRSSTGKRHCKKLYLHTNTITPPLHWLKAIDIAQREKSEKDERKVLITLTSNGIKLKDKATEIPIRLIEEF